MGTATTQKTPKAAQPKSRGSHRTSKGVYNPRTKARRVSTKRTKILQGSRSGSVRLTTHGPYSKRTKRKVRLGYQAAKSVYNRAQKTGSKGKIRAATGALRNWLRVLRRTGQSPRP